MTSADWSAGRALPEPEEMDELEVLPLLVQISDTEWVNPSKVVSVVFRDRDSATSADDPRVCIQMDGGHGFVIRDRTAVEVVALFNGEEE